jgi:hypothetical protein
MTQMFGFQCEARHRKARDGWLLEAQETPFKCREEMQIPRLPSAKRWPSVARDDILNIGAELKDLERLQYWRTTSLKLFNG